MPESGWNAEYPLILRGQRKRHVFSKGRGIRSQVHGNIQNLPLRDANGLPFSSDNGVSTLLSSSVVL